MGSSSSVNCVGVVKLAKQMKPGSVIVTLLCDNGSRHLTKFWNEQFLIEHNLQPTAKTLEEFIEYT